MHRYIDRERDPRALVVASQGRADDRREQHDRPAQSAPTRNDRGGVVGSLRRRITEQLDVEFQRFRAELPKSVDPTEKCPGPVGLVGDGGLQTVCGRRGSRFGDRIRTRRCLPRKTITAACHFVPHKGAHNLHMSPKGGPSNKKRRREEKKIYMGPLSETLSPKWGLTNKALRKTKALLSS